MWDIFVHVYLEQIHRSCIHRQTQCGAHIRRLINVLKMVPFAPDVLQSSTQVVADLLFICLIRSQWYQPVCYKYRPTTLYCTYVHTHTYAHRQYLLE